MADGKNPPGRPPERMRVTVSRKQMNQPAMTEDVLWPKGWPLPTSYDIVAAGALQGFVEHIEFDTDAERILIALR